MNLKISVITPSFNSGKFIEKAICSVLDQDYSRYEHIIIDGGSTDHTLDILRKYPHIIWTSEKDRGQVHAMNKGFARSTGDIIVYLNADDYFLCGAFSAVIPFFLQNHKFVVGDIVVQKPHDYFVNVPKVRLSEMVRHWEMNAFPYNPIGYFYRREVQENIPFDEDFPNMMDLRFLLESATKYEFTKIHSLLGIYRCLQKTKTLEDQENPRYWTRENFSFIDKYVEMLPKAQQVEFEADRERGYQLQRHWQQHSETDPRHALPHATARHSIWTKAGRFIRSKVKNGALNNFRPPKIASDPSPANPSKRAVHSELERYQERALDVASSYLDFQGKNILEIGGDMKFRVAREMIRRGAGHVISINYAPSFSSKKITEQIESINMDIRDLDQLKNTFDMVFGVAILEHLNDLDVVLRKIHSRVNTGGIVYLHGGPIWTSFVGHHVWIHTDDGCKYEFNNNNPVPDWGHLLYSSVEMHDILTRQGIPEKHCKLIIDYIYNSERLSRYSVENFIAFAKCSLFDIVAMNKIKWRSPDLKTSSILQSKYKSTYEDYSSGEIEIILKK